MIHCVKGRILILKDGSYFQKRLVVLMFPRVSYETKIVLDLFESIKPREFLKDYMFLDLLSILHPIQRQALLNSTLAKQARCLCNNLENTPYQKDKLRPF